ncbi:MAG TPA: ABC transporter substrate-binding protein, partial [Dermatophilaceae bacterium]|nr:ABC transporter substrate-binding protein [Dermatophilaceae bacterium]
MRIRRRGLAMGAVAVASALTLAACGSDSDDTGTTGGESAGAAGGTYSIGLETPQDLTPSNCYDLYCANILQGVTTGLYEFQTEGTSMKTVATPLLKSVTTADDGKTYVIEINPGSKFTNGEEVTAQTFVDTWNFTANGGNGQQLGFVFGSSQLNVEGYDAVADEKSTDGTMSGLKATSPTTIEVTLVAPIGQTLFENYVAGPQVLPMPSVAFEDLAAYNKNPIGNGPYMLKEPWSTTGATLVRNPDYAYEAGKADQIDFRFYADTNALWADLQANNLDVTTTLPQAALATAESVLGDRYINQTALSFSYEAYPTQVEAFKNRDVRVALAKAVNWTEINEKIYFNTRTTAKSFGPPSVAGGGEDVCGDDCVYDPAAAKALLEGAGGIPGNKVQVSGLANSENLAAKAECNFIQESLGVECEVKIFEDFGSMLDAFNALGADDEGFILGLGWGADNPTLANMIAPLFATGAGSNYTGYSNEQFDTLIAEGNQAADEATAITKWQEAARTCAARTAPTIRPQPRPSSRRLAASRATRSRCPAWPTARTWLPR